MPFVSVKLYEHRLNRDTEPKIIRALTDALVSVLGEEVRAATWVVLEPIPPRRWGVGGAPE